jgi:hypothetical protein
VKHREAACMCYRRFFVGGGVVSSGHPGLSARARAHARAYTYTRYLRVTVPD